MRAIHVNVEKREVREIEIDGLEDMQKAVGGLIAPTRCLSGLEELYVNDEGLLNEPRDFFLIQVDGFSAPFAFAGSGIICGFNEEGDTIACLLPLDEIKERIQFCDYLSLSLLARMGAIAN